jgi:hypothetical protein
MVCFHTIMLRREGQPNQKARRTKAGEGEIGRNSGTMRGFTALLNQLLLPSSHTVFSIHSNTVLNDIVRLA